MNAFACGWIILCVISITFVALPIWLRRPMAAKSETFAAPNFADHSNWAALPSRYGDGPDIVPAWCGVDGQDAASVDAFYVPGTAWFFAPNNGPLDDPLTNLLVESQLFQQANTFAGAAAVYSPRYRHASQGIQDRDNATMRWNWRDDGVEDPEVDAALRLAYSDVEAAFDYYLANFNHGRPFIIGGHSQGTMHTKRLLARIATRHPAALNRLVAAYLVGNTVEAEEVPVPLCDTPNATRCFVSWNTNVEGGPAGQHWIDKVKISKPACVNPLTWAADGAPANRSLALGSLPLLGHLFLPEMPSALVSARCGDDGILYVSPIPASAGWSYEPISDGGRLHAYDYNLFWRNVRLNVHTRVEAYLSEEVVSGARESYTPPPPEPCLACGSNPACLGGLAWQGLAGLLIGYVFLVLLTFACSLPCFCAVCARRRGVRPQLYEAVLCACCGPCYACFEGYRRRSRRGRGAGRRVAKATASSAPRGAESAVLKNEGL